MEKQKMIGESGRVLLLDGAMGTMIQRYGLGESDYRGAEFADLPGEMLGNNDMLSVTRPDVISAIHREYLEAGSDIIETNTFSSNRISLADYGMEEYVRQLNRASVQLARDLAREYTALTPEKPRFVAGSVGPTNKSASISPDVNNPALRSISYDELREAYREQMEELIEGGVDALLIETSFDTLNVKAALRAAEDAMEAVGKEVPLMLSFTIAGKSGRLLSGQTLEAALVSTSHANIFSVGLNCSFGASDMKPFLKQLRAATDCKISAYPNAGLPNSLGQYDQDPETMAREIQDYITEGLVDILGGCCGTTPGHIKAMDNGQLTIDNENNEYKSKLSIVNCQLSIEKLWLSGLDVLCVCPENHFVHVGERCNVAGSRKFLRLIKEKNYEEALDIARRQIVDGAQIIDINMDDGLLNGLEEMKNFLLLTASEPDIARVPVMIDSSDWTIIRESLKCVQGKAVVNSISLKNGEEDFLAKAREIRSFGAAVVAMAFDEMGQADSYNRKIEVCERMYKLLVNEAGYAGSDIIFDPNVLAIATGIEEHNGYGADFIRAVGWIKKNLPGAKVSGGVSNLSFSFRGNNYLREAMHSVFLYHAIQNGMDMGIVNPSTAVLYEDIPQELRDLLEDAVLNRRPDAADRLIEYAGTMDKSVGKENESVRKEAWRELPVTERLQHAIIQGVTEHLEKDLEEAVNLYASPIEIIDKPLMGGLNVVGDLFGEGKMFLPQVVKSARTMKKAVEILQPFLKEKGEGRKEKAGKILIATVKGDVHDIGKNITSVVLSCNNYEMVDIGVMVPAEEIIKRAREERADMIALSGLITPSLREMSIVAQEMQKEGMDIPLLIGGATTSKLHTALKIDPLYEGAVLHVVDASLAVPAANQLLNPETASDYKQEIKEEYRRLREGNDSKAPELVSLDYAQAHAFHIDWASYTPLIPRQEGIKEIEIPLVDAIPYINWKAFTAAWKVSPGKKEAIEVVSDARERLSHWLSRGYELIKAIVGFFPAGVEEDVIRIGDERIPTLRQQEKNESDVYYALSDFINPDGDYVGAFVVSVKKPETGCTCGFCGGQDAYEEMVEQILCDRLAEAATEYLHEKVRKELWGYAPNENFSPEELLKAPYKGIRPASGYPVLPDVSMNFTLDKLLDFGRIGTSLTENGALEPVSSTAGIVIAHPDSRYFYLGKIDQEQVESYAKKRGISPEEAGKWLGIIG